MVGASGRHLEGEAVADADAEQVYVGVGAAAGPSPRAKEEATAGGDAARAETAPQIDSGEPEQPADEVPATTAEKALKSVSVHDEPPSLT